MTIYIKPHQCPSHQSILLTQGPIHEILAEIAQLLVVVEKLSFFESAILIFFFCLIPIQINGVAWMGINFYDYHDFQKNQGGL